MTNDETAFHAAKSMRRRKTRAQLDYEASDEPITDPQEKYRIEFFNVLLVQAIMSMNERFNRMKEHYDHFAFLHNIGKIASMPESEVRKYCTDQNAILINDIDPVDL